MTVTVLGDFHAEKVHVREEMNRSIDSLLPDLILAPSMKQHALKKLVYYLYSDIALAWSSGRWTSYWK